MHKLVHATQSWEASKDVVKTVTQKTDAILPITSDKRTLEVVKVTAEMKVRNCKICSRNNRLGLLTCSCLPQAARAYGKLRIERANARLVGLRAKKAKEAAAKEEA